MSIRDRLAELRQRLKPDRATTLCLQSLSDCAAIFGEEWMWPEVRASINRALLRRTPARTRYVTDDNRAARLVLTLIADIATIWVAGGAFHTYRGLLNLQGQSLRDIAEIAIHQLHDADWIDYDERDAKLADLAERIAVAG